MAAAAAVAQKWVERQEERSACCADWHERNALGMPHTAAGQRLDAVLTVVEGALDTQIAALEKDVHAVTPAAGDSTSYSAAHLGAWLSQSQERAVLAEQRAAAAESAAEQRAAELGHLQAELHRQRTELERASAQLHSTSVENESLRSTCAALSRGEWRPNGLSECTTSASPSGGVVGSGGASRRRGYGRRQGRWEQLKR